MSDWRKRFLISLGLLIASLASWAGNAAGLLQELEGKSYRDSAPILQRYKQQKDSLREAISSFDTSSSDGFESLKSYLRERARLESGTGAKAPPPSAKAIAEKSGIEKWNERTSSNWLAKGMDALSKWLRDLNKSGNTPSNVGNISLPEWIAPLLRAVLIGAIVTLLAYLARYLLANRGKVKKVREALMDESEPDRTDDEWLLEGQSLSDRGEYRQAVRCYYLAILNLLDDREILEFDRSQTNWEHMRRYRKVAPEVHGGFDLLGPTQRFDIAWYGHQEQTQSDAEWFRQHYLGLKQQGVQAR